MDEVNIVPRQTRSWLMDSVSDPHVPEYCSYLSARRYAVHTTHIYVYCVAHFAHWLTAERLGLDHIDEEAAGASSLTICPGATARHRCAACRTRSGLPCPTCSRFCARGA